MAPVPAVMRKPAGDLKAKGVVKDTVVASELEKALLKAASQEARPAKALNKTQTLLKAALDTIASVPYVAAPAVGVRLHPAAFTSIDKDGFPSTRTVVPTFLAADLSEVRLSSRAGTRKLAEIEANPKASLHFMDQRGRGGWVTLKGEAALRPGGEEGAVEVVLSPQRCEVMSYVEGAMADDEGWKPAVLVKAKGEAWRRVQ